MSAATAIAFARAVPGYWCSVHPLVRQELARQRRLASAISDPGLRRVALTALAVKRANVDGAAAFAAFVPRARRAAAVRAQVSFQMLYDYLDVLAEQPHGDPVRNSRQLHGALAAALDPKAALDSGASGGGALAARGGYYAHHPVSDDGGYLQGTVERCQAALSALPGYAAVRAPAARLGARIVVYQSFNVTDAPGPREALERWAGERTPAGSGLSWWETAAAAGSSLGLFALIAMAAQPRASAEEALAVEGAYFPWVGALHSLLDSLIDLPEDRASGQPALVEHYGSPAATVAGLERLAEESRRRAAALPHRDRHVLVLAAMASSYLADPRAQAPHARPARRAVLRALGGPATAAMAVMRVRRMAWDVGQAAARIG